MERQDVEKKISSGNIGRWYDRVDRWTENFSNKIIEDNPDVKILIIPPETGQNGKKGFPARPSKIIYDGPYLINKNASDEKLAKILEVFDLITFDEEAYVIANYGFEGIDFDWEGEPYNSKPLQSKNFINETFNIPSIIRMYHRGLYILDIFIQHVDIAKPVYSYPNAEMAILASLPEYKKCYYYPQRYDLNGGQIDANNKMIDIFNHKLEPIVSRYMKTIIEGEAAIATSWDKYITDLKKNGLDEVIELYEKLPLVKR